MELTGVRGNRFVINPAFVRNYGHLFSIEGLEAISELDGSQLTKLIILLREDLFPPISIGQAFLNGSPVMQEGPKGCGSTYGGE